MFTKTFSAAPGSSIAMDLSSPHVILILIVLILILVRIISNFFNVTDIFLRPVVPYLVQFTHGLLVRKFCAQLFCTYILGLYYFGARISANKLLKKVGEIDHWDTQVTGVTI
jgi:hypothetical protein